MPESQPVTRFVGAALMAVGLLMMLLCGGCGAVFLVMFVGEGIAHPNDLAMGIMTPLFLGGLPALLGFGLFQGGRAVRGPRAPPASPPPHE